MSLILEELTTVENIDKQVLAWNDNFLLFLNEFKKDDLSLRFWLRTADRGERLSSGYWFQGFHYIYIGFSNRRDWYNKTSTIGFVLLFKENIAPRCFLEIVFKAEEDRKLIECYEDIIRSLGGFEKIEEKKYQKQLYGNDYLLLLKSFLDTDRKMINKVIYNHNLEDTMIIPEEKFQKSLSKTLKIRESMDSLDNTIYCILANITWNSKDWKDVSDDKSSHRWVVAGGTPHESWNFDLNNQRNPVDKIYGYVQFTHAPKVKDKKTLIIFYSDSKIVGFYGNAIIHEKPVKINQNESYNLVGDKSLSLVLPNKIENVKAKGYFGDRERVGMVGFIYLKKVDIINKILDEAISLNPEESTKLKSIKDWVNSSGTDFDGLPEEESDTSNSPENNAISLNQIFYGPPGTGKTYNTINEAIKIVEELTDSELKEKYPTREELKTAFQRYLNEEEPHIGFCTFHQSFSYEDFIEGIKPLEPNENDEYLKYDIVDGIFKKFCNNADSFDMRNKINTRSQKEPENKILSVLSNIDYASKSFYKLSLGDSTVEDDNEIYDYCIKNNKISIGWGHHLNLTGFNTESEIQKACKEDGQAEISSRFASYFKLYLKKDNYVVISNGNTRIRAIGIVTGEYEFMENPPIRHHHFRSVNWLIKDSDIPVKEFYDRQFQQQTIYKLKNQNIKPSFFSVSSESTEIGESGLPVFRNHVLIIDEINRGNISQIFGELITLIETDKRKGGEEELVAILPYSKKKFYVPSNLYIIGTMNTADRSVEALDSALRRRFCFKEMMPLYDLSQLSTEIMGLKLKTLLSIINERIEKLIDRDHLIGHSYFLNIRTAKGLMRVFKDNIIPLLQEYFYGNYEKMGLVLGKGFVEKLANSKVTFAEFPSEDFDYNEKIIYRLKEDPFESEENFQSALLTLLNNKKEIIAESE